MDHFLLNRINIDICQFANARLIITMCTRGLKGSKRRLLSTQAKSIFIYNYRNSRIREIEQSTDGRKYVR